MQVLLDQTSIHTKLQVRTVGEVVTESTTKGKQKTKIALFFITVKQKEKLNLLVEKNNASYSEIVRCLIGNADLTNYKYKTKGENRVEKLKNKIDALVQETVAKGLEKRKK